MKFTNDSIAPSGKHVLNMRIGAEEVEILRALVFNAMKYTPRIPETFDTRMRLKNMSKCFHSDAVRNAIAAKDGHCENENGH